MIEFPHKAPEGYYYEQIPFKNNVIAIWIVHNRRFDYNLGSPVRCIWGFWSSKTKKYYSPINSKTIGQEVEISQTTPYSAMIPKLSPLEMAFL